MSARRIYLPIVAVYFAMTFAACYLYTRNDSERHKIELRRHCEVIAGDVWDYDAKGPVEYLTLAARVNNYEYLRVYDEDGAVLLEIYGNEPSGMERFLTNLGILRSSRLTSPILHDGQVIGTITLSRRPSTVYGIAYIFLVATLICIVIIVVTKVIITNRELEDARNNLEERVKQRTAQLETEITERKNAEEELRESEGKFRTYIANAPDGIFIFDAKGVFIDVNDATYRITGYSKRELSQMTIADLDDPEEQTVLKNFSELKRFGHIKGEIKLRRKNNKIIWVSFEAVSLSENRYMAFCSDITEAKRLQELESRAERLETAGTIAGQVAHDFNNLLAPLMAYPEFIREEIPSDSPALRYLDQIESASHKIADINQDLLAMGRRGHYNLEILDINRIVKHVMSEMEPMAKTIVCETDLNENLMNVRGGSGQLHRVISNLIHNAIDAMRDIGRLTVKTENYYVDEDSVVYGRVPKGEYVKLTISDTGCGISDDIIQKICDPFFSTKKADKKRGSGLGMSVVDAVIKDHDGFIDLSTKIGEGTSFYIYLPITREAIDGQRPTEIIGGSERVLVVDDDDIQREVSSQILGKLGYKVSSVASGEEAIKYLMNNIADILVLDMVMPDGMDGAETYRSILEIVPNQRAILLSGFSESEKVFQAQKLGAGEFVKKPVTKQALGAAIRAELDRKPGREYVRIPH